MLSDSDFEVLKVKASVAPQSADWPKPDYSKVSIQGDRPHAAAGELHWGLLHDCVNDARTKMLKVLGQLAAVDEDKTLSPTGKVEKKRAIAEAAITYFESAKALVAARSAVEQQVAKWNKELAPPVENPTVAAEIRAHVSRLKDGDRLPFVAKNISECAPAVLQGPAFLSGLTPVEIEIVRKQFEVRINPDASDAKSKTLAALAHAEAGFRNAANTIRSRAGLDKVGNGGAAA
jgi:hypothetical protein